MSTTVSFIDVGQGNMTLLQLTNGNVFLYDCNVTGENESRVLSFIANQIGWNKPIHAFINSHREADHMRGVKKIHKYFPIQKVWECDVTGTTPNSTEYLEYMALRREVGCEPLRRHTYEDYGSTRLRVLNGKNDELPSNPNAQSIVLKISELNLQTGAELGSVVLAGDTDAVTWKNIGRHYGDDTLTCSILLASHHGSITFFDDPSDIHQYYVNHIKALEPAMTVISVGSNGHGHPHDQAVKLYEKYSTGSAQGNKIFRTDTHGNIRLKLLDQGGWELVPHA